MKILVTGSSGFIGYHLANKLIDHDHEVYGIDNMNNYYDESLKKNRLKILNQNDNFHFHEIDLFQNMEVKNFFRKIKPDLVINLAAQAGVRYSKENPLSYINSNIYGFTNLLESMIENDSKDLIYASSSSVYGSSKEIPFKEDIGLKSPVSLYGSTKLYNEKLASYFSKKFGLKAIGLRFFTVFGPFGRPDMAYYSFTQNIKKGNEITVFNEGKMSRDMTYISDIVSGIFSSIEYSQSMEEKNEIFNLGNNSPVSLEKLIEYIQKKLNRKAKIVYKFSKDEVKDTYASLDKSKSLIGFNPSISFEEGMNNFFEWYFKYYE